MLAGGYRGVLYVIKGDLDYLCKCLGLPDSKATNCCTWCPANLSNIPWWDFRPSALWAQQLYSALTVLAGACAIFQVPGVTLMSVAPDWMHNKHLGTDMYFYGSVLWLLVYVVLLDTPQQNLDALMIEVKQIYRENASQDDFSTSRSAALLHQWVSECH